MDLSCYVQLALQVIKTQILNQNSGTQLWWMSQSKAACCHVMSRSNPATHSSLTLQMLLLQIHKRISHLSYQELADILNLKYFPQFLLQEIIRTGVEMVMCDSKLSPWFLFTCHII